MREDRNEDRPVKKDYIAPDFVEYGEVIDLTRSM